MNEIQRLVGELRETYEGSPWHGTSVKEILSGVTSALASSKAADGAHSIWEMALHMSAWMDITRKRLGGNVVEVKPDDDWPPVTETKRESWEKTLERLDSCEKKLEEAIAGLDDQQLEKNAAGKDHTVLFMLEGVIYHNVYHSAQISLLKRISEKG